MNTRAQELSRAEKKQRGKKLTSDIAIIIYIGARGGRRQKVAKKEPEKVATTRLRVMSENGITHRGLLLDSQSQRQADTRDEEHVFRFQFDSSKTSPTQRAVRAK